jgi:hypothetical protein
MHQSERSRNIREATALVLAASSALAISCSRPSSAPDLGTAAPSAAVADTAISAEYVGDFSARWFSKHLAALEEAAVDSLKSDWDGRESYRFLWLRTFDRPMAIRIDHDKDGTTLTVKEADGKGGYAPGKLSRHETYALTEDQWASVSAAIQRCQFWEMPTNPVTKIDLGGGVMMCRGGSDGAMWILEASKESAYHIVARNTPIDDEFNKDQRYRECCLVFLDLARLDVPPDKVY